MALAGAVTSRPVRNGPDTNASGIHLHSTKSSGIGVRIRRIGGVAKWFPAAFDIGLFDAGACPRIGDSGARVRVGAQSGPHGLRARGAGRGDQVAHELAHPLDVATVGSEGIDQGRGDDDPVSAGADQCPDVGRSADAEADTDRDGRHGGDVADEPADGGRQRRSGPGHADERDAVQEPAASRSDRGSTLVGRGGRDEIDDS